MTETLEQKTEVKPIIDNQTFFRAGIIPLYTFKIAVVDAIKNNEPNCSLYLKLASLAPFEAVKCGTYLLMAYNMLGKN